MIFRARPERQQDGKTIPAEELKQHLSDVAKRAQNSLDTSTLPNAGILSEWAWLCGITHDFGKYTSFFQDKLPPTRKQPEKQAYGNHAFISALLGAFAAKERYSEHPEAALLVYLAIHRHHGQLVTPSDVLPQGRDLRDAPEFKRIETRSYLITGEQLRAIQVQIDDLRNSKNYEQIIQEMKELGIPEAEAFLKQSDWWQALDELNRLYKDLTSEGNVTLYWQAILLFSALIDADKHISAAAYQGKSAEASLRLELPSHLVDDYISTLEKPEETTEMQQRLFDIRAAVYDEATRAIETKDLQDLYPAVLSLTAPTGSGKTLTALGCAFRLRERIHSAYGTLPRIIYALPFVNIIDQNYNVTEKVLAQLKNFSVHKSNYLLKHHHLAPLAFKEDEDRSNDEALLLTESWESEIIVTTFVQLLQSLITNHNRALKKLHNIAGSIVILDEIQSIPYDQWRLVEHVLTTLTEHLGCTVLQMTATRPHIFTKTGKLLEHSKQHFEGLSRTKLVPRKDICNLEQLKDFILEQKASDVSMLVVLNTIYSAVELYKKLKGQHDENGEGIFAPYKELGREKLVGRRPLLHLSTNITPWQRKQRIRLLRLYMQRGGKPIVISTQVVEAGVDLDFDVVIRDQGPLDSIVQVAGRCNRNGTKGKSKAVYVVNLVRENGTPDAQLVYGKILPDISNRILTDPLEEPELYDRIDAYFGALPERLSDDKSHDFITAIDKLHFHFKDDVQKSVSDYRLIEQQEQASVFVELNSKATRLIQELENSIRKLKAAALTDKERDGLRFYIRSLWKKLSLFAITPTRYRLSKNPPVGKIFEDYYWVTNGDVAAENPAYYDMETGFKWEQETLIF